MLTLLWRQAAASLRVLVVLTLLTGILWTASRLPGRVARVTGQDEQRLRRLVADSPRAAISGYSASPA
jgi:hypothetical protein